MIAPRRTRVLTPGASRVLATSARESLVPYAHAADIESDRLAQGLPRCAVGLAGYVRLCVCYHPFLSTDHVAHLGPVNATMEPIGTPRRVHRPGPWPMP